MSTISYIKNFIKDPKVASITPTSRFTVEKVCQNIDFSNDLRIVEFGPADGVITKVLLKNLTPGSKIITLETNSDFVKTLEELEDDRLVNVNESAEEVGKIAASYNWDFADYIISGIPFSFLEKKDRHHILEQSGNLLTADGCFLAYQTSSHLKPFLKKHFRKVSTEMEYRNIPPMCIYTARDHVRQSE